MLSPKDFETLEETAYLMRSPANARRLLEAIHALEGRQGIVCDPESRRVSLTFSPQAWGDYTFWQAP